MGLKADQHNSLSHRYNWPCSIIANMSPGALQIKRTMYFWIHGWMFHCNEKTKRRRGIAETFQLKRYAIKAKCIHLSFFFNLLGKKRLPCSKRNSRLNEVPKGFCMNFPDILKLDIVSLGATFLKFKDIHYGCKRGNHTKRNKSGNRATPVMHRWRAWFFHQVCVSINPTISGLWG